jgi:hypothetical protein
MATNQSQKAEVVAALQQFSSVGRSRGHLAMSYHRDCQKLSREKHARLPFESRGGLHRASSEKSLVHLRGRIF